MTIVIRWLPGALWWQLAVTWRWHRPSRGTQVSGLVDYWRAGPVIILRLPDNTPEQAMARHRAHRAKHPID